jgi:hypothetical protein
MQKQKGITLVGMILTLAVVVFCGILLMRVVPVYIEQYQVINSIKSLNSLPQTEFSSDPSSDAHVLKSKLLNQLYVNSIESIRPEQIKISPQDGGKFQIFIKYKVVKPLVGNVSLLFKFKAEGKVTVRGE